MNLKKSKLVFGTAQLGMNYGLNNTHGQPTRQEAFSILDTALAAGITTFDTAYAYGEAEDVLGAWIKERSLAGKIHVISKMRPHTMNEYPDETKAADIVRLEIEKSLKRLNLDSLDGYLFQSPHFIYLSHMVEGMQKMREAGLVKHIGVSIYDEAEALKAAELGVDYVQVPYNAFDQRLDKINFFDLAQKNNVTVFARSPFLQGMLLMRPEQLPEHLSHIRPYVEQFTEIAKRHRLSPLQAALLFAHGGRADHLVFGAETPSQLAEIVAIVGSTASAMDSEWMTEMKQCFKNMNYAVINPRLWDNAKPRGGLQT
jgi:uncharacterized protein